jgi:hypothetical protein
MTLEERNALKLVKMDKTRSPKEWEMDPSPHYFVTKYGATTKIGKEITLAMEQYEEKCALAKMEMYIKVHELITHKPPKDLKKQLRKMNL